MASPTLDCPHCKAVLRPANPVPAGKKVACPKCKQSFTAGGEGPAPAPKPKPADDEDNSISSYGVSAVDDAPYEEPEAKGAGDGKKKKKKKKEEINYGPDNTLKDLRGPAIGVVTPISNNYLWHCAIMIVLAFASMMIGVWPFIFADRLLTPMQSLKEFYTAKIAAEGKGGNSQWTQRLKDAELDKLEWPIPVDRNGKKVREPDYGKSEMNKEEADAGEAYIGRAEKPTRLAWVISSFVVLAWAFVMAIGGVKMVTLESYGWAMTSAIMALVPVNLLGWLMLIWKPWDLLHEDLFCWISFYILPIMNIFSILFGIWMLTALTDQKVIDGFNFKGTDNE